MTEISQIGYTEFINMWVSGCRNLKDNIDNINSLNVFPVPDGDTGTNMYLTLQSAVEHISHEDNKVGEVAVKISKGSLMGARGNSGVILSQILRGFGEALANEEFLDAQLFAEALAKGVKTAYKAVMRPVEGTILTVCKDAARQAELSAEEHDDVITVLEQVINAANESLQRTPELLPVLKKAGVVDAGGQGLLTLMEGWYQALTGESVEIVDFVPVKEESQQKIWQSESSNEFGYCTEFIINADEQHVPALIARFEKYGDSLVVVGSEDVIKVHIHTMHPGTVLEVSLKYGELTNIKIENMQEQHSHLLTKANELQDAKPEKKDIAVIAVSVGEGLSEIFTSMGVDHVIRGGQTMNPSTEDLVRAIETVNAKNTIVLPNNSNVILTAMQCKDLVEENVEVVPSKTIPQGFAALMAYEKDISKINETIQNMKDNMKYVDSGEVTFATRDFEAECGDINKGDIIGINGGDIIVVGEKPLSVLMEMIDSMVKDDSEVITIFTGEEIDKSEISTLNDILSEKYDICDVEVHYGGQPLYYYLVSIE